MREESLRHFHWKIYICKHNSRVRNYNRVGVLSLQWCNGIESVITLHCHVRLKFQLCIVSDSGIYEAQPVVGLFIIPGRTHYGCLYAGNGPGAHSAAANNPWHHEASQFWQHSNSLGKSNFQTSGLNWLQAEETWVCSYKIPKITNTCIKKEIEIHAVKIPHLQNIQFNIVLQRRFFSINALDIKRFIVKA